VKLLTVAAFLLVLSTMFVRGEHRQLTRRAGDQGPATRAEINDPTAIAVDGSKTLYIVENGNVIRRVDLRTGIITTLQTKSRLEAISSLVIDTAGNLIAVEFTMDRVRRIDPRAGYVTTVAGGRKLAFSGDDGPAVNAGLNQTRDVAIDGLNNLYLADMGNGRIRRVDAQAGIITTVVGNGRRDSSGDGGPALDAGLEWPRSIAVDRDGNLFVAQLGAEPDGRIRRIDGKTGTIRTVVGAAVGPIGNGSLLPLGSAIPSSLLFDPLGNLYFVDGEGRVRRNDAKTQIIQTVAGSGTGFSGDGGPAIQARLDSPSALALDSEGNLYIAEFGNHRVRRVDARTGVIQTVAGNGLPHHVHVVR
jgi:DNA-binding beta-propeller fold protein YncE